MRLQLVLLLLLFYASCSSTPKHYRDDENFVLISEKESPNDEYKIIEYQFDNGALGYSRLFWAIIPSNNTKIDLYKYLLPDGYKATAWTNENAAIIEKWEPYYYKSEELDLKSGDIFNGVKIIIK